MPKKGNVKDYTNYHNVVLISHTSKIMLNFLQATFQQYVNQELPDVQAGFRKGRGTRDQIASVHWIIEAREFQKTIWFCFIAFDGVDHNKLWKFLKRWEYQTTLTCLLRNLDADQEATVRTGHGETDWLKIGKGVCQGYILSPCVFNIHAVYVIQNARLDGSQAGSKISGRNINNFRYPDVVSCFGFAQLFATLWTRLPASSAHGILLTRILEWVAMSSSIFLTQGLRLCLLWFLNCTYIPYFWATRGSPRYADDTTQMAESEEELTSVLMKVKQESEKANLKLNLQNIGTIPTKNWLEGLVLQKNKEKEDSEIKWG